jgi:hypothetical protein
MSQDLVTIESIIQAILLMVQIISMELKTFGIRKKECFENTMVLTEMPFYCLLRNVSFDLIMAALSNS